MKRYAKEIRVQRRDPQRFARLWTIEVNHALGIYATVGYLTHDVGVILLQSFSFDPGKGWNLAASKEWADKFHNWQFTPRRLRHG